MSTFYTSTSRCITFWTAVSVFQFFSLVTAELCSSGLECDYNEYCCGSTCCSSDGNYGYTYGYGFYNLWYFWFVIIMIMMTCCGACSYVKRRQHYMQQQGLGVDIMQSPTMVRPPNPLNHHNHHYQHHQNLNHQHQVLGVHPCAQLPSNSGPPVGTFPGPPAYSEVTDKPDQFPKADLGYPNYGFAAPPYSPPVPSETTHSGPAPSQTPSLTTASNDAVRTPYPLAPAAHQQAYPPTAAGQPTSPSAALTNSPPPYTPTPTSPGTAAPTPEEPNPTA